MDLHRCKIKSPSTPNSESFLQLEFLQNLFCLNLVTHSGVRIRTTPRITCMISFLSPYSLHRHSLKITGIPVSCILNNLVLYYQIYIKCLCWRNDTCDLHKRNKESGWHSNSVAGLGLGAVSTHSRFHAFLHESPENKHFFKLCGLHAD